LVGDRVPANGRGGAAMVGVRHAVRSGRGCVPAA